MARSWLIATVGIGTRGLLRAFAVLFLLGSAALAHAQLEPAPLLDFTQSAALPSVVANPVPTDRSYITPDGRLVPEPQANYLAGPQGIMPAQYQMGLAQLQPNSASPPSGPSMGSYGTTTTPYGPAATPYGQAQFLDAPLCAACEDEWDWRLLPTSLVYPSYWAAPKEPRFGGTHFFNGNGQLIEEGVLGARFGLLRYGTANDVVPQGWQWDVEGASFPRLTPYDSFDLRAVDFRIGTDCSYGIGPWRFRFGYYHLSSHVGDEYLLQNPSFNRINFKRETLIWGVSNYPTDWARLFFECGCAFSVDGEAKPLELIFGADLGTTAPTGFAGAPFAAVAGHLRQELDYGGDFVAQVGWMWRDKPYGHVMRVGFQYLTGFNPEYEFYRDYEQQYGIGLWYDF